MATRVKLGIAAGAARVTRGTRVTVRHDGLLCANCAGVLIHTPLSAKLTKGVNGPHRRRKPVALKALSARAK
jgi:hypothetical protein